MINRIYRLVDVKRIETVYSEISVESNQLIVRPEIFSICAADQRYYQGKRNKEVLQKKLPLALIHEGIGTILYDPKGEFKKGTRVALIPNLPFSQVTSVKENYASDSHFCSSSVDGFMQEFLLIRRDRVVEIPESDNNIYVLSELVSVAFNAFDFFEKNATGPMESIGIWGDGSVGFVMGLVLRSVYPDSKIYIFGKHERKLQYFTFATESYVIDNIPKDLILDHCFECVGGNGSEPAINQMINMIRPQGTISLLGVSENPVPINLRIVLEKGVKLIGNSRSGIQDFKEAIQLIHSNKSVQSYLKNIVSQVIEVNNEQDITYAFEQDQMNDFKTLLKWRI
jgi:ribitol-5-phosphate 2-dehydrogenase (NADP+)